MTIRTSAADNTDCDLVALLWGLLSDPASGKWYLGNIIRDGLEDQGLGISIPPFPTVTVGDIPEQTMFKWALEYLGVTMTGTVLSGLDSYSGGTMNCTPVSATETVIDLALTFSQTTFSGNYDVGTSGATGCAIATAAAVLGGGGAASAGEESRLELATWYRNVGLNESENGQVAVGAYYLHEDTIEKVTTSDTNAAKQYRQVLAGQKTSADAVTSSTRWYQQQKEGKNPPPPPPTIGAGTQYTGGFLTAVKLQYAVDAMRQAEGLALEPGNEYSELLNAMTQFDGQVKRFQRDYPGQRDTRTIMDYVDQAQHLSAEELKELGVEGVPHFDLDSGEVAGHVEPWPVDRDRALAARAARAPEPAAPEEWFHVKGTFADTAQDMTIGLTAAFTGDGTSLFAQARSTKLTMSNLDIKLGNSQGFAPWPGLYEKVSEWIANTQSFQDTLKSKAAAALNSPAVLAELTSILNAGLKKLGLQPTS
jgi:hypothetical protein